jgi:glycosyltransferase involved in cell wall biosynthesis
MRVPSLSVFFPAYNEQDNIIKLTETTLDLLYEIAGEYEVIIVNDGSSDNTGEISDELARRHPRVRVIHHERNLGYGAALKTGFTSAKNDYIFYTDGDNQFDVRELKRFVALIGLSDLVIGFRIRKRYTLYRNIVSFTYNLVLQLLFYLQYRDVDCAFKLVPKSLIEQISIESVRFFVDAELLLKAQTLGYSVTEIGVNHYHRETGLTTVKPKVILSTIKEMIWFYLRMRAQGQLRMPPECQPSALPGSVRHS